MFRFGDPGGRIYGTAGTGNANLLAWWTGIGGGAWSVSAGNGRSGGSSLRVSGGQGSGGGLAKTTDSQPTWGIAFGFRPVSWSAVTAPLQLCGMRDAGTPQVDLRMNLDNTISVTRNGTVLATSSTALTMNVYYHIEFKATVHNTAGNYEVRVNGTATGWIPAQGGTANTRATTINGANSTFVGNLVGNAGTITWDFDDIIIYDGQLTDLNGFADIHDFIGDCGLAWLLPGGAGSSTLWTPDTGVNYAQVADAIPDGDTSYVGSATVGQVDTYAMADLPALAAAVKSVAVVQSIRKSDTGSRGVKAVLRSAGANAAHAAEIVLGNSYQYYMSTFGQDPNAGTPANWTVAAVNALEAGQIVSS